MKYVVDSAEFGDRWTTMVFAVTVNSTVLLLYALYVVLFLFSIRTPRQRMSARYRFLILTAWVMFLLGTCGVLLVVISTGIAIHMVSLLVQGSSDTSSHLLHLYQTIALTQDIILATNNLMTDLLFLYRCYVIWGSRKRILVVPSVLILATVVVALICGLGYYGLINVDFYIDPRVPFSMGGATNILLMSLTAGRIWYIRREGQVVTGQRFRKRYNTAVAIILESGLLYCICVIIYVVSVSLNHGSTFATIFNGVSWGMVQLGVNIVPTLILVRVGMGRSTENTAPLSQENITVSYPVFAPNLKTGTPMHNQKEEDQLKSEEQKRWTAFSRERQI